MAFSFPKTKVNSALKDVISRSGLSVKDIQNDATVNNKSLYTTSSPSLSGASPVVAQPTASEQRDAQIEALRKKNDATRAAMSSAQNAAATSVASTQTPTPSQNVKPTTQTTKTYDISGYTTPTIPTQPTNTDRTQDDIAALRERIAKTYELSPEEVSLNQTLNNVLSSEEMGLNQIERQPIATRFITGQQAALQRQAATQATPLQRQLALLQAQREGTRGMLSSELGFLNTDAERATVEQNSLRTTLADIAKTAIENGATQEQVNTILSSGSAENALSYLSGISQTSGGGSSAYSNEIVALAQQVKNGDIDLSTVPSELRGQVAAAMGSVSANESIAGENTAVREANVVINNIDDAIKLIQGEGAGMINSAGNALMRQLLGGSGMVSRVLGAGGEAQTLRALLSPISGAIAFDRLQQMRDESKTGGALGQVSEREISLLSSIAGSLDTAQDTDTLLETLGEIKERFEKIKAVENPATSPDEYIALFPEATNEEIEQVINRYDKFMASQSFNTVGGDTQSAESVANAIAQVESGGSYSAVGPTTKNGNNAYGKYQIMDFNIPSWTQEFYGQSLTPEQFLNNPEAQDIVAIGKIQQLLDMYGTPGDVASVWFSGRPLSKSGNSADITGTTVPEYVRRVNANLS